MEYLRATSDDEMGEIGPLPTGFHPSAQGSHAGDPGFHPVKQKSFAGDPGLARFSPSPTRKSIAGSRL